jgi:formate hydrogenlyase subunit 6/NADH:ubiquinone oxidoreductase subunit I
VTRKGMPLVPSRYRSIEINHRVCTGCNKCVEICPMDVLAPSPKKGQAPKINYPEECWFCGCCVDSCPLGAKGAIRVIIPLPMRVSVLWGRRL